MSWVEIGGVEYRGEQVPDTGHITSIYVNGERVVLSPPQPLAKGDVVSVRFGDNGEPYLHVQRPQPPRWWRRWAVRLFRCLEVTPHE